MRCLILAAGRFDDALKTKIVEQREPRLDVFELQRELDADVIDYKDADASQHPAVKLAARASGPSGAVAMLGFLARKRYDGFFTTGEDIGLPLATLLKAAPGSYSPEQIAEVAVSGQVKPLYDSPRKRRMLIKAARDLAKGIETAATDPSHFRFSTCTRWGVTPARLAVSDLAP